MLIVEFAYPLVDFLGWLGHRKGHLSRILEDNGRELTNSRRHGGREQQRLALFRHHRYDAHDVVEKTHVEHAVCFIEHEVLKTRKVEISRIQKRNQSSGCGNEHIGPFFQRLVLLIPQCSIATAIDGD